MGKNAIALTEAQGLPVMMLAQERSQHMTVVDQISTSLQALADSYAKATGETGIWDFQQIDGKLFLVRIDAPAADQAAPVDVTE
jgi:hypothetical protein